MMSRYDAALPDGWLLTAWEPPCAELRTLFSQASPHPDLLPKGEGAVNPSSSGTEPHGRRRWGEGTLAQDLRNYLSKHPASSDACNALGIVHALHQSWPQALAAFDSAIFLTNQYHHYIHYNASALHTLRAEWATDAAARDTALKAALFQDHTNPRALALRAGQSPLPEYDLAMWHDEDWPTRIRPLADTLRDTVWNSGEHLCRDAAPFRVLVCKAVCLHASGETQAADALLEQAVPLAEQWHKHYHRQASIHRLQRGRVYEATGELWLARDEYRHAHDIDPGFDMPLSRREALARLVKQAGLL